MEVLWSDSVADRVLERKKKEFVVEGMWSPSGYFHIGNARPEIFTPYSVKRSMEEKKIKVQQNFIIDDFDAIRKIPNGLGIPEADHSKYLGIAYALAPSPVKGFSSWAEFFVSDVRAHVEAFGVELNVISAFESYKKGLFNDLILFTLEHAKDITRVWMRVAGSKKAEDFVPVQVVCESCKRMLSTKVTGWDGKKVSYGCDACKHSGAVSPLNGNAKLHWRVHWVAHWILHKVDFESAGKDHFSRGGSVDVGQALMREVFHVEPPIQVLTEFLQLSESGEKMSGSKGNVVNLGAWLYVASPELFRFMYFSYKPRTVIEFGFGDFFVLLNDRFEHAARMHYGVEPCKTDADLILKRAFAYSLIDPYSTMFKDLPPFPALAMIGQLVDATRFDESAWELGVQMQCIAPRVKAVQKSFFLERVRRARSWAELYAPPSMRVAFLPALPEPFSLSSDLRAAFLELVSVLEKRPSAEDIQLAVYNAAKSRGIAPKDLFKALYAALIGRDAGPRMHWLVLGLGVDRVIARLREAVL